MRQAGECLDFREMHADEEGFLERSEACFQAMVEL
jgi:hypothetical protein